MALRKAVATQTPDLTAAGTWRQGLHRAGSSEFGAKRPRHRPTGSSAHDPSRKFRRPDGTPGAAAQAAGLIVQGNFFNLTATNTVIATIPAGEYPEGVAVSQDGRRAYITNRNRLGSGHTTGTVMVIDTATNTVIGSPISVGNFPAGVAVGGPARHRDRASRSRAAPQSPRPRRPLAQCNRPRAFRQAAL